MEVDAKIRQKAPLLHFKTTNGKTEPGLNCMLDYKKYENIVDDFENLMIKNQSISGVKLGPDKWTLKEIVGHLIDSASNNHQRFVRLQIDKEIILPGYGAEEWVSLSNIQNLDYIFVVGFWKMYNKFLINLIKNINPLSLNNVWKTTGGGEYTLEFLIEDYFTHMKSHCQMFIDRQHQIEKLKAT